MEIERYIITSYDKDNHGGMWQGKLTNKGTLEFEIYGYSKRDAIEQWKLCGNQNIFPIIGIAYSPIADKPVNKALLYNIMSSIAPKLKVSWLR